VPHDLREAVAAVIDDGRLPGTPSTVIDFTGHEPYVIREGAASGADAIARARNAVN
jgi:tRNA A37 threonylcarbamoyladenosine synthetase subunit TsaC/SUA5/YrdC